MISEAEFVAAMRRRDPATGRIMPWLTHGALDEIAAWNLGDKTVLEWGGGASTLWWASRAARVFTVEHDPGWLIDPGAFALANVTVCAREDAADAAAYASIPPGCAPDVVVIDGLHRTACLRVALTLPRPLRIIVDNWQQDFVYLDDEAVRLMAPHEGRFYVQADHRDHEGRPWQTAIWELP